MRVCRRSRSSIRHSRECGNPARATAQRTADASRRVETGFPHSRECRSLYGFFVKAPTDKGLAVNSATSRQLHKSGYWPLLNMGLTKKLMHPIHVTGGNIRRQRHVVNPAFWRHIAPICRHERHESETCRKNAKTPTYLFDVFGVSPPAT